MLAAAARRCAEGSSSAGLHTETGAYDQITNHARMSSGCSEGPVYARISSNEHAYEAPANPAANPPPGARTQPTLQRTQVSRPLPEPPVPTRAVTKLHGQ